MGKFKRGEGITTLEKQTIEGNGIIGQPFDKVQKAAKLLKEKSNLMKYKDTDSSFVYNGTFWEACCFTDIEHHLIYKEIKNRLKK